MSLLSLLTLRIVPSPEQGTSQRIRSNLSCFSLLPPSSSSSSSGMKREGKFRASWLVTMQLLVPQERSWCIMVEHLLAFTSLAMTIPSPSCLLVSKFAPPADPTSPMACKICRVFEPGDAHKSSTCEGIRSRRGSEGRVHRQTLEELPPPHLVLDQPGRRKDVQLLLQLTGCQELRRDSHARRQLPGATPRSPVPGDGLQRLLAPSFLRPVTAGDVQLLGKVSDLLQHEGGGGGSTGGKDQGGSVGKLVDLILKVTGRRVFKHARKFGQSLSQTMLCCL
eukprot:757076-Hanusia_phi.AAC.4